VGYLVRATHSPQCAARDPEGFSTTHRCRIYWENRVRLMSLKAETEKEERGLLIRIYDIRGEVVALANV
jgi:hypothetical protein